MRKLSEKVWNQENKIGDLFKFDYDILPSLIPSDVNFRHSSIVTSKNKQGKEIE